MSTFGDVISAAIRYRDAKRAFEAHYDAIPAGAGAELKAWKGHRFALRKMVIAAEGALLGAAEQIDTV